MTIFLSADRGENNLLCIDKPHFLVAFSPNKSEPYIHEWLQIMIYEKKPMAFYYKVAAGSIAVVVLSFLLTAYVLLDNESPTQSTKNTESVDPRLSNDQIYLETLDAVAHMYKTQPCDALANIMLAHASNLSMSRLTRETMVYHVMKKAVKNCM